MIDDEQKQIVKIVNQNNEKYLTKINQIDQKVQKTLQDTDLLLHEYRNKYQDIKKDQEAIRRFKEDISSSIKNLNQQ